MLNDLKDISAHFGIAESEIKSSLISLNPEKLVTRNPSLMAISNAKKPFRAVFDYDPNYPVAVIRVITPHPSSQISSGN